MGGLPAAFSSRETNCALTYGQPVALDIGAALRHAGFATDRQSRLLAAATVDGEAHNFSYSVKTDLAILPQAVKAYSTS